MDSEGLRWYYLVPKGTRPLMSQLRVLNEDQRCLVLQLRCRTAKEKASGQPADLWYKQAPHSRPFSKHLKTDLPQLLSPKALTGPDSLWSSLHAKSLQSCPTLSSPMDRSPPGSSVRGILQARVLEWVAMPSSRGASRPRDGTLSSSISCVGRRVPYP